MSDTTDDTESSGPGSKAILGIAAVACVACCIGPILAVLGAIAALGLVSTIFIGAAGLLLPAPPLLRSSSSDAGVVRTPPVRSNPNKSPSS